MQLIFSSISSLGLGFYAFTMPACKPEKSTQKKTIFARFGLDALVLFKQRKMAVFFLFAMFLGAALQITNAFGGSFLESFNVTHPATFGVKHPIVLLSISQMSETLFILTIPFFLHRSSTLRAEFLSSHLALTNRLHPTFLSSYNIPFPVSLKFSLSLES